MIRSNEAVLLLSTSAPTFYKRVKKLWIELVVKIDSKGKASYIREEDLEELSKAMGKTLTTERQSARNEVEESSDSPSVPEQTVELLKEISDLKVEKTTLSSKVEEYSWYVELYKQQLATRETKVAELEKERQSLYMQIIKTQVTKNTYLVLFFAVLWVVLISIVLFFTNVIQLWA